MDNKLIQHQTNLSVPTPAAEQNDLLQIDDIIRFVGFVWRRKWLITLGVLSGILVGVLVYFKSSPAFESKAKLLVIRKSPLTVGDFGAHMAYADEDMSTHINVIQSPWLIGRAAELGDLKSFESFTDTTNIVNKVIGALTVVQEKKEEKSDSNVLAFALRGPISEECPVILSAVIEAYQQFLHESRQHDNEDALKVITQKARDIQAELDRKSAEYHRFRENTELIPSNGDDSGTIVRRVADLQSRLIDLKVNRAELESQLSEIKRYLTDLRGPIAALRLSAIYWRESESTLQERLLPLLQEDKRLSMDYGLGHPERQAVHDEIQLVRDLLADLAQDYMESLQQQIADIDVTEGMLRPQLEVERQRSKILANNELRDSLFTKEIARLEQLYENVVNQLQGIDLSQDSKGYSTTLIEPPTEPSQVAPRRVLIMAAATFLGICVGLGFGGWAEATDKSFRDPEAVRALGLPVLGRIPFFNTRSKKRRARGNTNGSIPLDPALCTYDRPASLEAEAYRGLRTALCFSNLSEQDQLVQVTSPVAGDGKTTLVANLGVSMAQSGKQVLLIDADLRQPRLHKIFELSNVEGLASILGGETEPMEVIRTSNVSGLDVLPAGPAPPNPADMLSSSRFKELLALLRQHYDYVLIDTPPLLPVSDARVVAALADGVLLTLRLTKNSRHNAGQAAEILNILGVNTIGVVINSSRGDKDRYGAYYARPNGQPERPNGRTPQSQERVPVGSGNGHGAVG